MWNFKKIKRKWNFGSWKYRRWWSKVQDKFSLFLIVVNVLEKTTLWKVIGCWERKVLNLSIFGMQEYNDNLFKKGSKRP